MGRILLLAEAATAVGLSVSQVDRMVMAKICQPARRATSQGSPHCFDRRDITALGIARRLRGQGWSFPAVASVTGWLYATPIQTIEEVLAEGRTILLATSGNGPAPRLIDAADLGLFATAMAKAAEAGIAFAVIDLKLCLERVDAYLAEAPVGARAN